MKHFDRLLDSAGVGNGNTQTQKIQHIVNRNSANDKRDRSLVRWISKNNGAVDSF